MGKPIIDPTLIKVKMLPNEIEIRAPILGIVHKKVTIEERKIFFG